MARWLRGLSKHVMKGVIRGVSRDARHAKRGLAMSANFPDDGKPMAVWISAMRFDFVDLRLLVHVAEAGNLTAGAARLPIALSAASQRIRKLETLFGVSLFERERDGVRLTADGERCVEHARLLLRGADRMQRELTHPAQQGRHVLRLAATTVTTAEFLPDVLGRFLALHPQVDVEIDERQSAAAIQAIRDGEHDLGIIDGNTGAERLALLPFSRDKLVLVAHAGHPLAARQQVSFAEALDHPFVALRPDSGMQQFIERAALLHGGKLQVRLRVPSFEALYRLVAAGAGLGVLPEAAALRYRSAGQPVTIVEFRDRWAERELKLCARDFVSLSPLQQTFVAFLTPA